MKDLSLKLLEDLVALSTTSNLYRAAELRSVTHPAFGRRVRTLEEWVGVPLVERSATATRLNPAGRAMLASAQEVLDILRETRETLQQPGRIRTTRITIAAGRTLSHSVLPALLAHLQRAFPSARWKVVTTSLDFGAGMPERGEADLLLCHTPQTLAAPVGGAALQGCRIGGDALVAVSAPLVPGYPRYRVPHTADEPETPFLAYAESMALGRIMRSRLGALCAVERLRTVYESDLADAILAMARQGTGLAWLPRTLVEEDIARGALVRADHAGRDIPVTIHLYRRASDTRALLRRIWARVEQLRDSGPHQAGPG